MFNTRILRYGNITFASWATEEKEKEGLAPSEATEISRLGFSAGTRSGQCSATPWWHANLGPWNLSRAFLLQGKPAGSERDDAEHRWARGAAHGIESASCLKWRQGFCDEIPRWAEGRDGFGVEGLVVDAFLGWAERMGLVGMLQLWGWEISERICGARKKQNILGTP